MLQTIQSFLKNTGCSYCQENDYSEDKNIFNNWSLYLKEEEMYSALVLYNKKYDKDISYYINLNDKIKLFKNNKLVLELEFISTNDDDNYAILVPDEKYQEYYQEIENKNKEFDTKLNSYYVENYDIKFVRNNN